MTELEELQLNIDLRLVDLWAETDRVGEWSSEVIGAFMRVAYERGRHDAWLPRDKA